MSKARGAHFKCSETEKEGRLKIEHSSSVSKCPTIIPKWTQGKSLMDCRKRLRSNFGPFLGFGRLVSLAEYYSRYRQTAGITAQNSSQWSRDLGVTFRTGEVRKIRRGQERDV